MTVVKRMVILLMLMAAVATGVAANAADTHAMEEDLYAEIVEFVVSRDPVLQAQRTVMQAARAMDTVEVGDESVPSYAQGSLLRMKFDAVSGIQQAQQQYTTLERELVSALFAKLTQIFALRNQVENSIRLLQMLEERRGPTERQAEAGIIDMNVLWDLSDRIVTTQIAIADAESQLRALEREAAFNYGGADWAQLLDKIQRIR